ncbi:MAG: hypothetical protein H6Q16_2044 [Bacteroidetes bacterium]|nr:hypothetical protein [Bacteroidota bacterium]
MPDKIRIYNSNYNRVFPVIEGKKKELIAKAKKLGVNYELISSSLAQQTQQVAQPSQTSAQPKK